MLDTIRKSEIDTYREIDTRIAAAWNEFWKVQDKVIKTQKTLRVYKSMGPRYAADIERISAKEAEYVVIAESLRAAVIELDAKEYTGWTRFYLVKHIHNTQHCSSFRWNTRIGWLPSVSGLTEQEAVAEYGATLCTKCFPSAPVEGAR
jgi:hypothetical protein